MKTAGKTLDGARTYLPFKDDPLREYTRLNVDVAGLIATKRSWHPLTQLERPRMADVGG